MSDACDRARVALAFGRSDPEVARHVATCDVCRADMPALRHVATALAAAEAPSPPAALAARVRAAAAPLLAVLLTLAYGAVPLLAERQARLRREERHA